MTENIEQAELREKLTILIKGGIKITQVEPWESTTFIVSRWGYYNPNLISDCLRGYSKQSDSKEEV